MSIYVDGQTRLLVQGITGREGSFHTGHMVEYGTKVVGGVTPGKGGQSVHGVPVFDTVAEAVAETGANCSLIYVPARFCADAILESADAGVPLVITITEQVPVHDMIRVSTALQARGTTMIGPNCPGLISPGSAKVGIIPGSICAPGPVGVVSRSGTLTYEVLFALTERGIGQTTAVGIGGDPVQGTKFVDVLASFEDDPETEVIVLIGEIGGSDEEAAAIVREHGTDPKELGGQVARRSQPLDERIGGIEVMRRVFRARLRVPDVPRQHAVGFGGDAIVPALGRQRGRGLELALRDGELAQQGHGVPEAQVHLGGERVVTESLCLRKQCQQAVSGRCVRSGAHAGGRQMHAPLEASECAAVARRLRLGDVGGESVEVVAHVHRRHCAHGSRGALEDQGVRFAQHLHDRGELVVTSVEACRSQIERGFVLAVVDVGRPAGRLAPAGDRVGVGVEGRLHRLGGLLDVRKLGVGERRVDPLASVVVPRRLPRRAVVVARHREAGRRQRGHEREPTEAVHRPPTTGRSRRIETIDQVVHRSEPAPWIGLESPHERAPNVAWHLDVAGDSPHLPTVLGAGERENVVTGERSLAVERLVERRTQPELIRLREHDTAVLLGSHVCGRAHHRAGGGQRVVRAIRAGFLARLGRAVVASPGRAGSSGEAQVEHDDLAFVVDHHVLGLEVAVDEPGPMRRGESSTRGTEELDELGPGRLPARQQVSQRLATDVLHRDEHVAALGSDVEHLDHVGMRQRGHRLRLAEQPSSTVGVRAPVARAQELQRDAPIQLRIVGEHHHAHPPAPEGLEHDVAPDPGARLDRPTRGRVVASGRVHPRLDKRLLRLPHPASMVARRKRESRPGFGPNRRLVACFG